MNAIAIHIMTKFGITLTLLFLLTLSCGNSDPPVEDWPEMPASPAPVQDKPAPVNPVADTETPTPDVAPPTPDIPAQLLQEYASCNGRYGGPDYRNRHAAAQRGLEAGTITTEGLKNEIGIQCGERQSRPARRFHVDQPTVAPLSRFNIPTPRFVSQSDSLDAQAALVRRLTAITITQRAYRLSLQNGDRPAKGNPFIAYLMHGAEIADCAALAFGGVQPGRSAANPSQQQLVTLYQDEIDLAYWCFDQRAGDLQRSEQWLKLDPEERRDRYRALLAFAFESHRHEHGIEDGPSLDSCRLRYLERAGDEISVLAAAAQYRMDYEAIARCISALQEDPQ